MESEVGRVVKLQNHEQWNIWKFQVKVILKSNGAWNVVEGTNIKPEAPGENANAAARREFAEKNAAWEKSDGFAQKIIVTTISEQNTLHILACESSKSMWNKLTGIYEQKSDTSVFMLQEKLFTMQRDTGDSIATQVAKIEDVVHRLELLGEKVNDKMVMTKILLTLPSGYNHFVTSWESTAEADKTKENLISRLLREEMRVESRSENALLTDKQNSNKKGKGKDKNDTDNKKKKKKTFKCFKCDKPGHYAKDCWSKNSKGKAEGKEDAEKKKESQGAALINEALAVVQSGKNCVNSWFLDSGASNHMTPHREFIHNYKPLQHDKWVRIGDGTLLKALGTGDVNINTSDGKSWFKNHLAEVIHVPGLKYNLFSSNAALDKGLHMTSDNKVCKFSKQGKLIAIGVRENNLFTMKFKMSDVVNNEAKAMVASSESLQIWHNKLAHQNYQRVKKVLKDMNIDIKDKSEPFCSACAIGKAHRLPFKLSETKTSYIGELVHADLCGPMQSTSNGGSRYFLLLKDDFSNYRTLYFVKNKSDVYDCLVCFVKKAEKHCPKGIKTLRTDNGLEFVNNQVSRLLQKHGITHQRTVSYTPEQNGSAERENRTLVEAARTLLISSSSSKAFWAEAVHTAAYVYNRTGKSKVENKSPFEVWFEKKPDICDLHTFGEKVYCHIPKEKRRKLDDKGKEGMFIGYEENVKGYRIWFADKKKVEVSRDVIFTGIMSDSTDTEQKDDSLFLYTSPIQDEKLESQLHEGAADMNQQEHIENIQQENLYDNHPEIQVQDEEDVDVLNPEIQEGLDMLLLENQQENLIEDVEADLENQEAERRENMPEKRTLRDRNLINKPAKYKDFINIDELFIADVQEPDTYHAAMNGEESVHWKQAMIDELGSIKKNNVWQLVDFPNSGCILGTRWIFKIKRDAKGDIARFKARLVVKGYMQKEGIDYHETFSPVARYDSIRLIFAVVAKEGFTMRQFDVKTAFLYGDISEKIYVRQPEGFSDGSNKVYRLMRSLYGLKQASRCWNFRFTQFLLKHQLVATKADPCVFTSNNKKGRLILAIYIDDGLVASDSEELIDILLLDLQKEFEVVHGEVSMYLGFQVKFLEDGSILLHQSVYTNRILKRFNMGNANPVAIPADIHDELCTAVHSANDEETNAPYREAVGALMYLSVMSRPDITLAVHRVSRYMQKPTKIHWNAVKRIFKYLKGTSHMGLLFKASDKSILNVFCDSDYAGDLDTRKSTTGYVVMLNNGILTWSTRKQCTTAVSTTDAEYIAACEAVKEIVWIKELIKEIYNKSDVHTVLRIDNQSAIKLAKNPVHHRRTKHIEVRFHFIREMYQKKLFELEYINTNDQIADILTKPLPKKLFEKHRSKLLSG